MRQRKLSSLAALGAIVLGIILPSASPIGGLVMAGASTGTLGVSLTIAAGCSVRYDPGTEPLLVACDNVVPYRMEVRPAVVAVVPESADSGAPHDVDARNIVVIY